MGRVGVGGSGGGGLGGWGVDGLGREWGCWQCSIIMYASKLN